MPAPFTAIAFVFSDGWPEEPDEWTPEDQNVFKRDLRAAERILADTIDEAEHLAPGTDSPSVDEPDKPPLPRPSGGPEQSAPPVHVNVYNVLSQMTVVSTAQILASHQELNLAPSDRAEAEKLALDFEREAEGKQRWSRLGKTVDRLKSLGEPVYDKVAVPLLLEYLRRQLGIGGR